MADRSVVTAWVVLVVSLVALVALFDWAFVHVVGRPTPSVVRTGATDPVSGVHGTATGSDARAASVLESSASQAVSSASAGEAVTESVAVPPADGELAVAKTPGAATAGVDAPATEAAEDVAAGTAEITPVETIGEARVEAAEVTSVEAIEDASASTVEEASAEAIEGEPAETIVVTSVGAAGSATEERAEENVVADASSDGVTAVGETARAAVPDIDTEDEPTNDAAAEAPADVVREAAATPLPEAAAALPGGPVPDRSSIATDRTTIANGANVDADTEVGTEAETNIDTDTDTDADLEALRRLLAEATAIEAATEPLGEEKETSGERAVSGDATSRRAPATVLDDLAEAIRFEPRSAAFGRDATIALDELAVLLADRPDLTVTVGVAVDDFGDDTRDRVLGRERGRAIIAELVARGVAFERLSLSTDDAGASSPGSHRVRIVADTDG